MEFNLPNGYTAIRTEELQNIKKLADEFIKFVKTYHIYNRQLNGIFKTAEDIIKPPAPQATKEQPNGNT